MDYTTLGSTDLKISRLCLGSMTWGEQNTEAEGHAQLDMALEAGINFIDTAEMYPIAPRRETYGATETIIGNWLKLRGNREDLVLATKIVGPAPSFKYIRDGELRIDRKNIEAAIEASLKRLQTDYVDLYQIHWPERSFNGFGRREFKPVEGETFTPLEETLEVMGELVEAGRIRHFGLSNETPWGVMKFVQIAEAKGLPRVVSVQNWYNLIGRTYEIGMAEVSCRENVGLLAYSPLAAGMLTGKYRNGAMPEGARLSKWAGRYPRLEGEKVSRAVAAYWDLAAAHELDPAQMAIAYCLTKPFLASAILGATTRAQLANNLAAMDLTLSDAVLEGIEKIQTENPDPAP
jgi:aryl-alcohol dehydrogenase-like predicted oxidoreductase